MTNGKLYNKYSERKERGVLPAGQTTRKKNGVKFGRYCFPVFVHHQTLVSIIE